MSERRIISSARSEEHTSELQSHHDLVCRLLLEKKKKNVNISSAGYVICYRPCQARAPSKGKGFMARRCSVRPNRGGGCLVFFFNDTATTEISTLSLHDALPI